MTRIASSKRTRERRTLAAICVVAMTTMGVGIVCHGPTLVLWNASASVPEGLYFVQPNAPLHVGDLAVSTLPADARVLAAERQYLPSNVLLIKPVAATSGSKICRRGRTVSVDGNHVGDARPFDRLHRTMPDWQGCHELAASEIFLMNPAVPDSFDGRYFGPTSLGLAQGRAFPLLTFAQRPRN